MGFRIVRTQDARIFKAETDEDGAVDAGHGGGRKRADAREQPPFVQRADLFEQDDGILGESEGVGEFDVCGKAGFSDPARHGRRDDGGGIFVSRVVLDDENGAHAALFAPDDGGEIGIIEFSAFDDHNFLFGAGGSAISICNGASSRAPQGDDCPILRKIYAFSPHSCD